MSANIRLSSDVRRRVLKSGQIVFNNKSSVLNCTVRTIGDDGALVRLDAATAIPQNVSLVVDGKYLPCRIVEQRGTDIDLEFLAGA